MQNKLKKELNVLADKKQAQILQRFFKTGIGEYGAGDVFLGVKVPAQRKIAGKYMDLPLSDIEKLLHARIHEYRQSALIILVNQFKSADEKTKAKIFRFYLANTKRVNNWDLVDLSAPHIVGAYLMDKPREILHQLAESKLLWERRIAIVATHAFIRAGDFADTFALTKILMNDKHDLIQKAQGWMLREIGKKSDVGEIELRAFLDEYAPLMPHVSLRYALEKFDAKTRKKYLLL